MSGELALTKMDIDVEIIADSTAGHGIRLTTFELTLPMFIQPQLLRHRMFSFSVQSTRAVPLKEQIRRVRENPAMPIRWGVAQKGMVADKAFECGSEEHLTAETIWRDDAENACVRAERYLELGVHQEIAARILSPFAWCRCIVTATDWDNFFALRIDKHAQAEIRILAETMRDLLENSEPEFVKYGEWATPFVNGDELAELADPDSEDGGWRGSKVWANACLVSAGRCARVSYLQHDGKRDAARDLKLAQKLAGDAHWSPLEHQATPMVTSPECYSGNLRGWTQFRKMFRNEHNRALWLKDKPRE